MDCQISHAGIRTTLRRAVLAACSLPLLSFTGSVFATDGVNPSFDIRSRLDMREMRVEAPAGVGNNLAAVFREQQASRTSLAATASARGFRTQGDDVLTDVVLKAYSSDLARRIEAAGGVVRSISERHLRASVLVSSESEAAAIGALPEVRWVAADHGAHRNVGSVTSRAVDALDVTPIAGAPHNLDGTGQTIGIISDSFARTSDVVDGDTTTDGSPISGSGNSSPVTLENSTPQDSGDLPATVVLRRDDGTPPSGGSLIDEGAAMAELVHDLAPGADIAFYTAFFNFSEFAAGIDDLCTSSGSGGAGATVVVDDIIYFAELMYQPDIITQAAADCVSSGVPYFSSAGNNGDSAFRQTYSDIDNTDNDDDETDGDGDGSPAGEPSGDFHDWNPGGGGDKTLGITLEDGEAISAILQWNQPALSVPQNTSNGPRVDLDMYLFDTDAPFEPGTGVLASSFLQQSHASSTTGQDPVELIQYINSSGGTQTVYLGIDHWGGSRATIPQDAGTDLEFRLVFYETGTPTYEYTPDGPAMYGHALASGAVSVAAVPWWEAPSFDPAGQGATVNIDPESFTSRGGTIPFHFEADGSFAASTVEEPDLAAVDGNNNTFFGQTSGLPSVDSEPDSFPNFFGTSAAAPNAAAIAALLLQDSSSLSPNEIEEKLRRSAVDVTGNRASSGCDSVTGPGLIDAEEALSAVSGRPEFDGPQSVDAGAGEDVELFIGFSGAPGETYVYEWEQISGPNALISDADTITPDVVVPNISSDASIVFEAKITDSTCLSDASTFTINVAGSGGDSGGGGGGGSFGWLLLGLLGAGARRRLRTT